VSAVLTLGSAFLVAAGWAAFGAAPSGERKARIERSPQWHDGRFENPQPMFNDSLAALEAMGSSSQYVSPLQPVPVVPGSRERFASPPQSGLRVTWLGHSNVLIELDGVVLLTDPTFSERASPYGWVGPRRWYPPLIALEDLPPVDVVLISHDHYDHLDMGTIQAMRSWSNLFVVPLGVGAHLAAWGIPDSRIVELDWWEERAVKGVRVTCTPARHASGRQVLDYGRTLWASWSLLGPAHRLYYSGDTGLFPALKEIGERLGPFDLTLIEVGQYNRAWPDWHIGPEQAVRAHGMLRGRRLLPIHWGLFQLAAHGWTEPIERVWLAAKAAQVELYTPRPGESFEPDLGGPRERWWPDLPFQTAADHPIRSTRVE
jgi:L-ascorbate metabolism protein UlaG (beta-lactamase superfamily)